MKKKEYSVPIQVGILGGGQLAQMLCLAAHGMGIRPFVLGHKTSDCASHVTKDFFIDNGSDDEVRKFFNLVDVVTIENEFIDLKRFERILGQEFADKLLPGVDTLKLVQSKLDQKNFLKKNKISTLEFTEIHKLSDIDEAYETFKGNIVFKKARLGYDGRGTYIFSGHKDQSRFSEFKLNLPANIENFGYAEKLAPFQKEIALITTRSTKGETKTYPIVETYQDGGMCQWAMSPPKIKKSAFKIAQSMAEKIMLNLGAVGTFGIEMFVMKTGDIVINEIAPRVHNSGHLTMNGALTSQFEQHLRAIVGWPLGEAVLVQPTAMVNIIGKKDTQTYGASQIRVATVEKNTWIHWYGKSGDALGRKLGHINSVASTAESALKVAQRQRQKILI
jgi:phosphoribosylaminoimidazole carboxylase PurK protein